MHFASNLQAGQMLGRTYRLQHGQYRGYLAAPLRRCASYNNGNSGFAKLSDPPTSSQGFFTPEFMSVLEGALERHGDDALLSGPPAEEREAAEVEMMELAVAHCIDRLQMLERMHKTVEAALQAETRQLQRLKFVQDKIVGSAAYTRTLKKMLDDVEREGTDRYRSATGSMLSSWDNSSSDDEASAYSKEINGTSSNGNMHQVGAGSHGNDTPSYGSSYDWQSNNWSSANAESRPGQSSSTSSWDSYASTGRGEGSEQGRSDWSSGTGGRGTDAYASRRSGGDNRRRGGGRPGR